MIISGEKELCVADGVDMKGIKVAADSTPQMVKEKGLEQLVDEGLKNMLTRRKESDTYLATVSRHHWSRQITMIIGKIL